MIRYDEGANNWISGMNPDGQGFPTTDLTGDFIVCNCADCVIALRNKLGTNYEEARVLFNREMGINA